MKWVQIHPLKSVPLPLYTVKGIFQGAWHNMKSLLQTPNSDFKTIKTNELYEPILEGTLESNVTVIEIQ